MRALCASALCLFTVLFGTDFAFGADVVSGGLDLTSKYKADANRLIDAALEDQAGYDKLTFLCDRIGNRLSGSPTMYEAIKWAAEQMKNDGLVNVVTPPVKVPHWVRGQESAQLLAPVVKPLHMLGLGMSVGTSVDGITADVLVVNNFDELTRLGDKVKGKIVLFNVPYEGYGRTVAYRVFGASKAASQGAAAMLVRSVTPLALQQPHTGSLEYDAGQPKIPAAAVSIEDATMLARLQASGAIPRVHLTMQAHQEEDSDGANVIGEIPGSEHPEQVVVMGGHLDSWDVGQGAQDDGSGVMATLEAAALIKHLGLKPRRTLRIVFWANEENGARGGAAYANWIGEHVKDHVAAIEMDDGAETPVGFGYGQGDFSFKPRPEARKKPNVGGGAEQGLEQSASFAACQQIAALLARIGADKVNKGGGGTDIEPIVRLGVPSLSPTTTAAHYFDWHHTQADTVDKVNLDDFRRNIAVLAVLAYVLADMPGQLEASAVASTN